MPTPDEAQQRPRRIFSDLSSEARADASAERPAHGGKRLALLTLVASLTATGALAFWTDDVVKSEAGERFSARVGELHARIGERMLGYARPRACSRSPPPFRGRPGNPSSAAWISSASSPVSPPWPSPSC